MIIECTIKRKGGTVVDMNTQVYHFRETEQTKGCHCCEVSNEEHLSKFLAISESYRIFGSKDDQPKNDDDEPGLDDELDPEEMSNNELISWAESKGINPKSKQSIQDYALTHHEADLDHRMSPVNMIRSIIKIELEAAE